MWRGCEESVEHYVQTFFWNISERPGRRFAVPELDSWNSECGENFFFP
jgi:hypothetical protein